MELSQIEILKQKKLNTFYQVKSENPFLTIKDIDLTKRIITGFYNTAYYFDKDWDVLIPGAAKKSILERGPDSNSVGKIKHALFHDLTKLPGKILVLEEKTIDNITGIYFETKMLNTTDGNDTLIKYQEEVYDNHSIGFRYLQLEYMEEDSDDWDRVLQLLINPEDAEKVGYLWLVKEIDLYEGSTVAFGANQLTPYLGSKSSDPNIVKIKLFERIDLLTKQLKTGTVSDDSMRNFELQILQIKQMINEFEPSNKSTPIEPDQKGTPIDYKGLRDTYIKNFKR